MTILALGRGPRMDWLRSVLDAWHRNDAMADVHFVEGLPTRELLASLVTKTIDALILVDHSPFAAAIAAPDGPAEAIRNEAYRAVFALELAGRADQMLVLAGHSAADYLAALATVLRAPLPSDLHSSFPLPASTTVQITTPLTHSYLEPLFAIAKDAAPLVLAWPREAFLDGDAPGETLPASIEVAGRARILAYGPYLPLPAGPWRATIFLGFSPDIGKLPFILEADTGGAVARGFFEVEFGGIFTLELEFEVADMLHPVEFRLISQDSALEGQVALIEVRLEQCAMP